jgi:hypothetical protein
LGHPKKRTEGPLRVGYGPLREARAGVQARGGIGQWSANNSLWTSSHESSTIIWCAVTLSYEMAILRTLAFLCFVCALNNALSQVVSTPSFDRYSSRVTAFNISLNVPRNFVYRRDARLYEPCTNENLYPLRGLSFEMRCEHWDELNNQAWGLGRMEAIDQPFKSAFRSPEMR